MPHLQSYIEPTATITKIMEVVLLLQQRNSNSMWP